MDRGLSIETPLDRDALLLTRMHGTETVSQLFCFELELLAGVDTAIAFERVVGQKATVEVQLGDGQTRRFGGLIRRLSEGARDEVFVHYRAQLVPEVWLLTKRTRSRIFQQLSVPEILRQVLAGFDMVYNIAGKYHSRDYCTQYGESDFAFASRLMEEEGIYYFFRYKDGVQQMVVSDAPNQHPSIGGTGELPYESATGNVRGEMHVTAWEKSQEIRAREYAGWDYCFELPGQHLDAREETVGSIQVGEVTHSLALAPRHTLEIYEYPGGYAKRFDGVDEHGGTRAGDLRAVFEDRRRTIRIRMEQEEATCVEIRGASDCGYLAPGHNFRLQEHFNGDGQYFLTGVEHEAKAAGYNNSETVEFSYLNRFTCVPAATRYRPPRLTPRVVMAGVQTATVVGPAGEQIFCDKYGRVKVQFHWDREGKMDGNSSCWLRVAQIWAGSGWGAFFWPRVGHEVVVAFEDGDPDQPIITGSVYNARNMPPYALPLNNQIAGLRSASVHGSAQTNFNGILFDDQKDQEHLAIHSERHMSFNAEYDKVFHGGRHKGERVAGANVFTVGRLPGGGGSGGGGDEASKYWPKPYPQGVLGLNSTMVFGENMQTVVGTNHQLAIGNNFQLCINPIGLLACAESMPEPAFFTEILGSGVGGNMQMTVGTNVQMVYGRNIEVDTGMPKIELHGGTPDENKLTYAIVAVIGAVALAYVLGYALLEKDWQRATTTIAFQICMDLELSILLKLELEKKQTGDDEREKARQELVESNKHINWTMEDMGEYMGSPMKISPSASEAFQALIVTIGAAILPLVIVAEHAKDPEKADQQSSKTGAIA